jgi:DnaJ-class molecular chaperone
MVQCPKCDGTGKERYIGPLDLKFKKCEVCFGTGKVTKTIRRDFYVRQVEKREDKSNE